MRYQRISPDSLPLSNGKRAISNPNMKIYFKEDEEDKVDANPNGLSRFRSPLKMEKQQENPPNGGDVLLQWGHRKRSRCSRGLAASSPSSADDSSSSSSMQQQPNKLQRRSSAPQASPSYAMPPPSPLLPSSSSNGGGAAAKGSNITKSCLRNASSTATSPVRRSQEDRSAGGGGDKSTQPPVPTHVGCSSKTVPSRSRAGKRSPSVDKKAPSSPGPLQEQQQRKQEHEHHRHRHRHDDEAAMGINGKAPVCAPPSQIHVGSSANDDDDNNDNNNNNNHSKAVREKTNGGVVEVNQFPRIYIPLSRKEKEEDFLAMKGTKLPHRPKKRPKAVDRMLQYCYAGMWLSELSTARYEVREKKSTKKPKRRGLKGMEGMESDSE